MKNIKLLENNLLKIIRKIINEESKTQNLRHQLNDLMDNEFSDIDPSDAAEVFEFFAKVYRSNEYRKKHNIGDVTVNDVRRNFKLKN